MNPGVLWGLATAAAWGTADFAGGLASRRAVPMVVTAGSQAIGLLALLVGALLLRPPLPDRSRSWPSARWPASAAGWGWRSCTRAWPGAMGIVSSLAGAGAWSFRCWSASSWERRSLPWPSRAWA